MATGMNSAVSSVKVMATFATGLVGLAIASVIGIAVLVGFKNSGTLDATGNSTIDLFVTGIAVFGTFASILALVLVGKIVLGLVKHA